VAVASVAVLLVVAVVSRGPALGAAGQNPTLSLQDPTTLTDTQIRDRLAALQREAADLARQSRTLLGQLRQLEVERDLQVVRANRANAAVADGRAALEESTERLRDLERTRIAQLPELERRLVDLYKHGRRGYALRLAAVQNARDFARALRVVSSLAFTNQQQIAEHRKTLELLRRERAESAAQLLKLQADQSEADRARLAADRAVAGRMALLQTIDERRDLTAQLTGELQVAGDRLRAQISSLESRDSTAVSSTSPALAQGALTWPLAGRVTTLFGEGADRAGQFAVRNGIEIEAAADTPVLAVSNGVVAYADPFVGFGTLVIVDHGARSYSLYGYLRSATVAKGDSVRVGTELGRVGTAPQGAPGLYLEVRVDGRPVDPVQWLKPRN
jgi:septal ring factor EnvC (AmiA/AmiB activator)